jgi:S1-C subfamily serine protease
MNAFKAAGRTLPLVLAMLVLAAPALAADKPGYLGVMLQDMTPAMAKALQIENDGGVLVSDVVDDSPAEKAGLEDGDVIVSFGGKAVTPDTPLTKLVAAAAPGDEVDVVVLRDGKLKTIKVELGERKNDVFAWTQAGPGGEDIEILMKQLQDGEKEMTIILGDDTDRGWLGVRIDDLNAQLGEYFGVEGGKGVLVAEVVDDSPAAKAGLKAGDVITAVGETAVADMDELHKALADSESGDEVKIAFKRKGKDKTADVTLGEAPESELKQMQFHGQDGEFEIMAPRMMHRHMAPMDQHHMRMYRMPEKRVEIIREMELEDEELDALREELGQLRKELDELRKELKK